MGSDVYEIRTLTEVAKLCEYLKDYQIEMVSTYNNKVANCFIALGYDVTEVARCKWNICRKEEEPEEDIGYDF